MIRRTHSCSVSSALCAGGVTIRELVSPSSGTSSVWVMTVIEPTRESEPYLRVLLTHNFDCCCCCHQFYFPWYAFIQREWILHCNICSSEIPQCQLHDLPCPAQAIYHRYPWKENNNQSFFWYWLFLSFSFDDFFVVLTFCPIPSFVAMIAVEMKSSVIILRSSLIFVLLSGLRWRIKVVQNPLLRVPRVVFSLENVSKSFR